jgi:catechol 2,3-dioxygenase-like lactoylglutathione lyase family enzyme
MKLDFALRLDYRLGLRGQHRSSIGRVDMARLRHFAVCVGDLDRSARFYSEVFDLKEVGRETLDIGSAIYMSDGVVNLALLNFAGRRGNDVKGDPTKAIGANHFGSRLTISPKRRNALRRPEEHSFSILARSGTEISNASSRIRMASCSIFRSTDGSARTADGDREF